MSNCKQASVELQGNFTLPGTEFRLSTVNLMSEASQLRVESFAKMIEIVKKRSHSADAVLVTAVVGKEDFVPTSFLETGLKKSAPVCRISRYFDLPTFRAFVGMLATKLSERKSQSHNFDTIEKINEVFSIPPQVADTLFTDSVRQHIAEGNTTGLEVLQTISETQLSKILPIPVGTGFLVGGSHMLTNQHVIPDIETAEQCVAQFSFVDSATSETARTTDYELDATFFISNPALDYTLIQLKSSMITRQAGFEFGWIQLVEDTENVVPRLKWIEPEIKPENISELTEKFKEPIDILTKKGYEVLQDDTLMLWHPDSSLKEDFYNIEISVIDWLMEQRFIKKSEAGDAAIIVQHPKGRRKQVVLNNNEIVGLYKDYLRYEADTDYGSSGSPVFNDRWELVGLHHAAVNPSTEVSGDAASQPAPAKKIQFHQAIRICSIIEDLKKKSAENHRLRGFIDDFVMTKEHAQFPPLPCALTFDGTNDYIELTEPGLIGAGLVKLELAELVRTGRSWSRQSNRKPNVDNLSQDFSEFTIEAWVNPYQSDATTTIFSQSCTEPWYEHFGDDSIFGEYLLSLQVTPEGTVLFSREPLWKVSSADFPSHGLLYPLLPPTKAAKSYTPVRRVHPLDLLTIETDEPLKITREAAVSDDDSDDEKQRNQRFQRFLYGEKVKALQLVLYCLGFFSEAHYSVREDSAHENGESLHSAHLKVLTGELDEDSKQAIASFNDWVEPTIKYEEDTGLVTIPAEVIDLFNRRGLVLGAGTKQKNAAQQDTEQTAPEQQDTEQIAPEQTAPEQTAPEQTDETDSLEKSVALRRRKDHYGPRVSELQYCLRSLDWKNNPLFRERSSSTSSSTKVQRSCRAHRHLTLPPEVSVTGHYSWWNRPDRSGTITTTAYAIRKLQHAFYQHSDGILSALSLSALEKAKSYRVATREGLPPGRFSHIAVTFDGQEVRIYINGQLSNRRYTGEHSNGGYVSQALLGTRPRRASTRSSQATHRAYFEEAISELRIWNKSLSQKEITRGLDHRLSNKECKNADLVGYWRLEEGQIEDEVDKYRLCLLAEPTEDTANAQQAEDHDSIASKKGKRHLVEVSWVDRSRDDRSDYQESDKRHRDFSVRVFDGDGKLFVSARGDEDWFDEKLQQKLWLMQKALQQDATKKETLQTTATQSGDLKASMMQAEPHSRDLLRAVLSKIGYSTNAYFVYNAALSNAAANTYAAKSKFRGQDKKAPVRLQSARNFPVVPLSFGLTIDHKISLIHQAEGKGETDEEIFPAASASIFPAAPDEHSGGAHVGQIAEAGMTVELWMRHKYGNGKILSGGSGSSEIYTLVWSDGKIRLTLEKSDRSPVQIETKDPVVNQRVWHHVAFSWVAETQEIVLYVDGKRQQAIALQVQEMQTLSYKDTYQSIIKFPVDRFDIDPQSVTLLPDAKSDTDSFCCSVTELRLWRVARPQSTIKSCLAQRIKESQTYRDDLVAYWRLDNPRELIDHATTQNTHQNAIHLSPPVQTVSQAALFEQKEPMFLDVDAKHWASPFIKGLQKVGLSGLFVNAGTEEFRPNDTISRQELAILLLNTFGGKPKANRANVLLQFKDEHEIDRRYLEDIEYAWRLGLISGDVIAENATDDSRRILEITFNPTVEVSRGIAVSAIFDALREYWDDYKSDVYGNSVNDDLEQVLKRYRDVPKGAAKFLDWIPRKRIALALQKNMIVHQRKNSPTLDLEKPVTRAEIAAMLYQAVCLQPGSLSTQFEVKQIISAHVLSNVADV